MFKRVILEEWASVIPMIAFGSLAAVFLITTIRALLMRACDRERMAQLPLTDQPDPENTEISHES
ncbi:hypothetical protein OKA05_12490 [Luteolibacter arcticus]|uniref:Uncharacterized protein n=1 Tax=Luteolibacter arcticus TaxID=1581411 RepID=A0ABT3GIP6_9BACT|nr:hypothetical protein [Luteolibacter arcticus]MCW1923375.1 hypothetical protein [Luteolibacter arcticus]